jgi:hypothetical protein
MSVFTNEVTVGNVVPVSGPLTDAELRATAVSVAVSGSVAVSNFPATQPVSGSVSVANFPATQPVSGAVTVSNFPATQPVSGPLTDAQLRAVPVPISGTVSTTPAAASSSTIARAATSNASSLILAANANRKKAIIMTETGTANYVALAATSSLTAYTYLLGSTTVLEITGYTGPVSLIRASGTGNVQVTELV